MRNAPRSPGRAQNAEIVEGKLEDRLWPKGEVDGDRRYAWSFYLKDKKTGNWSYITSHIGDDPKLIATNDKQLKTWKNVKAFPTRATWIEEKSIWRFTEV